MLFYAGLVERNPSLSILRLTADVIDVNPPAHFSCDVASRMAELN